MVEGGISAWTQERIRRQMGSEIDDIKLMEGGYIGNVYRVLLSDGNKVAVKTGEYSLWIEYLMLDYLRRNTTVPVPTVIDVSDEFMMMEFISGGRVGITAAERDVAKHLARLHDVSSDAFGFVCDTLAGTLIQPNPWIESWVEFFRSQRLQYATHEARSQEWFTADLYERVQDLSDDLEELLPESVTPSLLHGDIHEYNIITDDDKVRAFIDPALYFGHHEVELAYISFESDYGDGFFDAYFTFSEKSSSGYRERLPIYKVYLILARSLVVEYEDYSVALSNALNRAGY